MADFSSIAIAVNSNTDASPSWTTIISFGGTAGANELRFCGTGLGAGNLGSASWPYTTRPTAGVAAVTELWAYTTNTSGVKCATYDGGRTNSLVGRLNFSNDGTLASLPRFSAFANSTNPAPSAGTQVDNPTDGANIINGANPDTGTSPITSYLKANAFGSGLTAAGSQETPSAGACGSTLAATSGTAGAATPSAGAWLATWQSLQGWVQYIQAPAIPQANTLFYWYFSLALFMGVTLKPGVMPFCPIVYDYTYA